jgi:ribose transport system ATP-binding protein
VSVLVRNLSRTFSGTTALDRVSLEVESGEIHALVGGNGSGKSTLIKILSGVQPGDPGGDLVYGDTVIPADRITAQAAHAAGVRVVHQDLGIFQGMSIAENLCLGQRFPTRLGRINKAAARRRAEGLIERFEIPGAPSTLLGDMSRSGQTLVAIARALQDAEPGGLLILDEPTASLPEHEVEMVLRAVKRRAEQGQGILYVSHRLDEILAITDRISVLRDGHLVGTHATRDVDEPKLVELIIGRQLAGHEPEPSRAGKRVVLEVRGLSAGPLRGIDLQVREGEIVGLAGLLGSGRSEVLRAVFGDLDIDQGTVLIDREVVSFRHPRDAMGTGICLVPENRELEAAFSDMPVYGNLAAASIPRYWRRGWLRDRQMKRDSRLIMKEYLVKAANESTSLDTLSGGNQQKVIMARWLRRKPRLLLLDEPAQGVDVGARAEIYALIRAAVAEGAAAVVVASDLEELAHGVDRAVVLRDGQIVAHVGPDELGAGHLTRLSYGMEGSLSHVS